jgi:glycosyltransferase involved in cell wall biosynthesis
MLKNLYFSGGGIKHESNHPSIKRRFARFIQRKNYKLANWEQAEANEECVVLVSQTADLTYWKRLKDKNVAVIFESNDPYVLDQSESMKTIFRGTFKFCIRRHTYWEFDFKKTVMDLCRSVDAVVVGHYKVYDMLKSIVPNVHLIPDYSVDISLKKKQDFQLPSSGQINIFWEGLGSSYIPFEDINRIFKQVKNYNFVFHFVTDLSFHAIANKYAKKYVFEVAKKKAPDMYHSFRFYQWSEFSYNNIGVLSDFAIIPLPFDNSMNYYKPENKLIQMWRMGLPTITSAIPSYIRAFDGAGLNEYCFNDDEWRAKIINFAENLEDRKRNSEMGIAFVEKYYSNEVIDELWQNVIDSVEKV